MSGVDQLAKARAARDWAKAEFDASLAQLRSDLEEQSIGARVKEKLRDDAYDAYHEALEVANESKGIIAGTIAALALWFLRHPIIAWAQHLLGWAEESDNHD
ncbi:MAG: hypothetical protein ABIM50_11345 [Novosphingobium sp.]